MSTAEEKKAECILKMGRELGEPYYALWKQLVYLNVKWQGYIELFGTKPSRIDLMNEAAPSFFGRLEQEKWESILLHLARLTDPPQSKGKSNLTVQQLPGLVGDAVLQKHLSERVQAAVASTKFCRDWRNKRLAHNDLEYELNPSAVPLENGSRADVKRALEFLADIMNAISDHYLNSTTGFSIGSMGRGEWHLLSVLYDGVRERRERNARIENRELIDRDKPPDI